MQKTFPRLLTRLGLALAVACGFATAAAAQLVVATRTIDTQNGRLRVDTLVRNLSHPWGMEMIPDGAILITERSGQLRFLDNNLQLSPPLKGLPEIRTGGQGGLLDIALDPRFDENGVIYLCYSEAGEGGAGTAVARGRLAVDALEQVKVIYRQQPKVDGPNHFGCRLAFARDGALFVTLGERFKFTPAQDLGSALGKIVRIGRTGDIPKDNPFAERKDARPEIWSFGHRNVQGAAIHPRTGALWVSEFGPAGGDEINIAKPGANYGWPLVSWGEHYNGDPIPQPGTRPDLAGSVHHWTPAISPSGIAFCTLETLPGWQGSLLVAGLSSEALVRLSIDGEKVTGEERIDIGERVRDVMEGMDAAIYLLTDSSDGELLRLTPDE